MLEKKTKNTKRKGEPYRNFPLKVERGPPAKRCPEASKDGVFDDAT